MQSGRFRIMIEIKVPKDIQEFEPTLIGPFTARHLVCAIAIVVLTYGGYLAEKALGIEDPITVPFFCLLAIPPALIGWVRIYGMHFEKFAGKAFRENFVAPAKRLYKVDNMWDDILKEEESEARSAAREEARKEGKQYTPPKKEQWKEIPRGQLPQELRPYK